MNRAYDIFKATSVMLKYILLTDAPPVPPFKPLNETGMG